MTSFIMILIAQRANGMRYRSRTAIISDILGVANKRSGVGRTKIMYKAFLSYAQLKEYPSSGHYCCCS